MVFRVVRGALAECEVEGSMIIFERSVANLKPRYINVISEGDSKAFNAVKEAKPYGEEVLVEKYNSCTKTLYKKKKALIKQGGTDDEGNRVSLGSKKGVTQQSIFKKQTIYQSAIRNNKNSEGMVM